MIYTVVRQQSAVCTELRCVENITCTKRRLFVSLQVLYVSLEFPSSHAQLETKGYSIK